MVDIQNLVKEFIMKKVLLIAVIVCTFLLACSDEGSEGSIADTFSKDIISHMDSSYYDVVIADQISDQSSVDIEDISIDIAQDAQIEDASIVDTLLSDEIYDFIDASDTSESVDIIDASSDIFEDTLSEDITGSEDGGTIDTNYADTSSNDFIIPPIKNCQNLANPCVQAQMDNRIFATYRKDYYLNDSDYNEYTDYPVDGGRFHIAMVSNVTGKITSIFIDGENVENMLIKPKMEWYHYWPEKVNAGEILWFAFHSRDKKWDSATSGNIVIETDNGTAVNGQFEIKKTKVPLTYITTSEDMSEFIIFLKNTDTVSHTIKSIKLNSKEVFTNNIACVSDRKIKANEAVMITIPLCKKTEAGSPYTVVVEFEDDNPSVGVGRVIKPFFPIEAWPNSSECPVPGGNQDNYQAAINASIDTIFAYMDNNKCNLDWFNLVNNVLPTLGNFYLLIADGFTSFPNADKLISNTSFVAGFMTGDESDGEVWDDNNIPNASKKAKESQKLWGWYPDVPTYNGAKTNGNVGTFAGMADIQGIDFYVAACAPHITAWGKHPPLRGAYDYLKNTRNNHMPLTTWMYAQGLSPVWNKNDGKIHVQPDPQEIIVQGYSVMAAGGKGLMWFQMNQDEADHKPERWAAISEVGKTYRAIRKYLREGDITGMAKGSDDSIVDMIRSKDVLIVPVIGLKTSKAPTDIACGTALISEALVPHWVLADQSVNIEVTIPDDFGVYEIFEISLGKISSTKVNYKINGRKIIIENISINNTVPAKIFVFARDAKVKNEVNLILK